MIDCVDKTDILHTFQKYCDDNCPYSEKQRDVMCGACFMGDAIEIVEDLPSVQPERAKGLWVEIDDYPHDDWECNKCGGQVYGTNAPYEEYKFCPNCGARMDGEQE